jgi:predicted nucleic acid-binding protein
MDHLNGVSAAGDFLRAHAADSVISVITVNEVLAGSALHAAQSHELLLEQFECLELDRITAKVSAALRRVHGWKLADSVQAAFALSRGLTLVTRNHRDFKPSVHHFVIVPYQL